MTTTLTAIGLMSGSSMDGIDAALIRSDGRDQIKAVAFISVPYAAEFRDRLRTVIGAEAPPERLAVAHDLVQEHAKAVTQLLNKAGMTADQIDVIGFHGHTAFHDPAHGITEQMGEGRELARLTGIDVYDRLRSADVEAGGQGAPMAPVFHRAMAAKLERPLAVLNIGGIANVTFIGADDGIAAFDTGPGIGPIDDWVLQNTGEPCDWDGKLAEAGTVDEAILQNMLEDPYFAQPRPKSLDRLHFTCEAVSGLSVENGAATLTEFTAQAIRKGLETLPEKPHRWLVCGGGRHNPALVDRIRHAVQAPVEAVEAIGYDGDAIEAQCWAYLAIRARHGLPLSYPGTTGVDRPMTGGILSRADVDIK